MRSNTDHNPNPSPTLKSIPGGGPWDFEIYEDPGSGPESPSSPPAPAPAPVPVPAPATVPRRVRFRDGTDSITEATSPMQRSPEARWTPTRPPTPPVPHGHQAAAAARTALELADAYPGRVRLLTGAWGVVVRMSQPQPADENGVEPSSSVLSEAQANDTSTSISGSRPTSGSRSAPAPAPLVTLVIRTRPHASMARPVPTRDTQQHRVRLPEDTGSDTTNLLENVGS